MRLFIIAGETSGDLYGAQVVECLKNLDPGIDIMAWGEDKMAAAGAQITTHISELNVMGFIEVAMKLPRLLALFKRCKSQIEHFAPAAVLFIDFSGFNLRMAKWAKHRGIVTHWYIAPKTWAWRESREKKIRKYVDYLYCILPFEEDYFRKNGINAAYVGHPLTQVIHSIDRETEDQPKADRSLAGIKPNRIALLPGSRIQEIRKTLPVLGQLIKSNPRYLWSIAAVSNIPVALYHKWLKMESSDRLQIAFDSTYELLQNANMAIVTSGTATLEAALIGVPQIVIYRTSSLNYFLAKNLLKTRFISLPNLILNKPCVIELIQSDFNIRNMESSLLLLENRRHIRRITQDYAEIRNALGKEFAAQKVAQNILKTHKTS